MKKNIIYVLLSIFLMMGCSTISLKSKMAKFEMISDYYRVSMIRSDFGAAYQLLDPSVIKKKKIDRLKYKNIKVNEYEVKNVIMSDNKLEIIQIVQIEYYLLNQLIVRTIQDDQLWKYNEEKKTWLLFSGPPDFNF